MDLSEIILSGSLFIGFSIIAVVIIINKNDK